MVGEPSHGAFLRLSARNRARSPKHFANSLGIAAQAVLAGHHREKIECWAGLPAGTLGSFSARPSHITRVVDLRNEMVALGDWSIGQRRVCSTCVAEDYQFAVNCQLPSEATIYHRAYWDVRSISSCSKHFVSLISECPRCQRPLSWADPAVGKCSSGCSLITGTPTEESHEIDQYLAFRLGFGAGTTHPQLDQFEYRHVVRFCELLGHLKRYGWSDRKPASLPTECSAARRLGFSIAKDLERYLWPLLDEILTCSRAKSRSNGIIAAYGWVYTQWASEDLAIAKPIRSILRAHAVVNGVIAPQEPILDFDFSPTLSMQQIRSQLGSGHNSTRRRLSAAGLIAPATRRGVKCAIDPSAIQVIQGLPTETALGTRLIGKRLGIGRGCARDLLVLGFLEERESGRSKRAIDEFASTLLAKCGAFPPTNAKLIKEAAKNRNVRLADILSAILGDRLSAWLVPESCNQLLADRLMVVPYKIRAKDDKSIPIAKAAIILSLHPEAVGQLVQHGYLSRKDGRGLSAESIARFHKKFVALAPLANARKTASRALSRDLEASGIKPVFAPPQFRQILYDRHDLRALGTATSKAISNG